MEKLTEDVRRLQTNRSVEASKLDFLSGSYRKSEVNASQMSLLDQLED
jgi:hypothetical protein